MDIISSDNVGKFYRYVNNKLGNTKTVHPTKIGTSKNGLNDNPVEQANISLMITSVVCLQWITESHHIFKRVQIIKLSAILSFLQQTMFVRHYYRLNLAPLLVLPDGMPNVLLKKHAHYIYNPPCYIFDSSFKLHCLPSQWLQAFVTPVFKKGTTSDHANYKPISLTCTCRRVMERIIINPRY